MQKSNDSRDFVDALLAQDPLVSSTDYGRHRDEILERIARSQRRERLSRWATVSLASVAMAGMSLLGGANMGEIGHADTWPEWAKNLAATSFLLLPVAVLLVVAVYLLHHTAA